MPEIRQNIATREWVIIATERTKRPEQFVVTEQKESLPEIDPACPFCVGNEKNTPPEVFSINKNGKWSVRVVMNKFAALSPKVDKTHSRKGVERNMNGFGYHEVIVETPKHNLTTAQLSVEQVEKIIYAYKQRYTEILKDHRIETIIIFKNHGVGAGTSLIHPHSQIIATPMVPTQVRERLRAAMEYYDDNGDCVFCYTLREELQTQKRIVENSKYFVAFVPYASGSPFMLWILPKRHQASFAEINDDEMKDLAVVLKKVLAKIYVGLNNPDFNYVIRSLPGLPRQNNYFHWYVSIVPRITKTAGFEMGSGMFINVTLPEDCAEFLRKVDEKSIL